MKKLIFFVVGFLVSISWGQAQVAINHDGSDPASNTILHLKGSAEIPVVVTDDKARIGVGTTAPQRAIDIYRNSTDGYDGYIGLHIFRDNVYGGGMHVYHARGTQEAPEALRRGDLLGYFGFLGYDGSTFAKGGSFRFLIDAEPAEGVLPTRFQLNLTDTAGVEKIPVVVRSSGRVGIGTLTPLAKLQVVELFNLNGAQRGLYNYVIARPPAVNDRTFYTAMDNTMVVPDDVENDLKLLRPLVNGLYVRGNGYVNNMYTQFNTAHLYNTRTAGNFNSIHSTISLQDDSYASYFRGILNSMAVKGNATVKQIFGQVNAINYLSSQTLPETKIYAAYNTVNLKGSGNINSASGTVEVITHNNPDSIKTIYGSQHLINNAADAGPVTTIMNNRVSITHSSSSSIKNVYGNYTRVSNMGSGEMHNVYVSNPSFVNSQGSKVTGILYGLRIAAENRDSSSVTNYKGIYQSYSNLGSQSITGTAYGIYSDLMNYSPETVGTFTGINNAINNWENAGDISNVQLSQNTFIHSSDAMIGTVNGVYALVRNRGGGTINVIYSLRANLDNISGSVNKWYGLYIDPKDENPNYWGVYVGAGNKSYFGGKVGVGITNPERELDIDGVMHLRPRDTEPANPSDGDIYMDDGTNTSDHKPKLRVYADGAWHELW